MGTNQEQQGHRAQPAPSPGAGLLPSTGRAGSSRRGLHCQGGHGPRMRHCRQPRLMTASPLSRRPSDSLHENSPLCLASSRLRAQPSPQGQRCHPTAGTGHLSPCWVRLPFQGAQLEAGRFEPPSGFEHEDNCRAHGETPCRVSQLRGGGGARHYC